MFSKEEIRRRAQGMWNIKVVRFLLLSVLFLPGIYGQANTRIIALPTINEAGFTLTVIGAGITIVRPGFTLHLPTFTLPGVPTVPIPTGLLGTAKLQPTTPQQPQETLGPGSEPSSTYMLTFETAGPLGPVSSPSRSQTDLKVTSPASSPTSPSSDESNTKQKAISTGAIAGIAVAAVIFGFSFAALLFIITRRRNRLMDQQPPVPPGPGQFDPEKQQTAGVPGNAPQVSYPLLAELDARNRDAAVIAPVELPDSPRDQSSGTLEPKTYTETMPLGHYPARV